MQITDPTKIPGWGVDRRQESRPGVPMERAVTSTTTVEPPAQPAREPVMKSVSVSRMPPVFGTAIPPRGLSGAMRKVAYTIPEHRARHWLLLLLADRVDVVEGLVTDLATPRTMLIGGGVLGLGIVGWVLGRRR